jgi:CPA2 family monovalent cation:H+ antiporter-2
VVQVTTIMQLGSTLLLFYIGMDFSVNNVARRVTYVAGPAFVVAIAFAALLALPLVSPFLVADVADETASPAQGNTEAVVAGLVVAMSASGSTTRHLRRTSTLDSAHGATITALYLGQDLAFFLILALVPLARVLAGLEGGFVPSIGLFRVSTPSSSQNGGGALAFLSGRLLILALLAASFHTLLPRAAVLARGCSRRWGRGEEKKQDFAAIASVSLCVLLYSLSLLVTGSEVGAFIAGSLVTSSGLFRAQGKESIKVGLRPLRHLFSALSFASSGMLLQPRFLVSHALLLALFVVGLQAFKYALAYGILKGTGLPRGVALRSAAGIAQVGECAFVLNSQAMSAGLLGEGTYNLLQSATALSILCSPLFRLILGNGLPGAES